MKVCAIVHGMSPLAGYGRHASLLIEGLRARGVDVVVLKEEDDGYDGTPLVRRGLGIIASARAVRPYVRSSDVVHALDVYPYGIVAALARRRTVPFVLSAVGTYSVAPLYNWKTRWLARYAVRSADVTTAISRFTKDEVAKMAPAFASARVITPGVEVGRFAQPPRPYPAGEKIVVSVGSVSPRKGYHVSIPAFAEARKVIPHLRYVIVSGKGTGSYADQLRDIVHRYGVADAVEFRRGISDVELGDLYGDASLFVLASVNIGHHFEGFGMVFVEAAAAGLPVVGTAGNGIEDAVQDGVTGVLVPQNDVKATARAMVDILQQGERWKAMSNAGRMWAQQYTVEHMVDATLEVYRGLV